MIRNTQSVTYNLTYKNVKNINLRIGKNLSINVSANKNIPIAVIDSFVESKAIWISEAKQRIISRQKIKEPDLNKWDDKECLELFQSISDKIYPLFKDSIEIKPAIKIRAMKSCWGVCHPRKNYITLNKLLMSKPLAAIEYVVMHEYIHYLHMNHQREFYKELAKKMPDYLARKKLLK